MMDTLLAAHEKLRRRGGLQKPLDDINDILACLQHARNSFSVSGSGMELAQSSNDIKQKFTKLNDDVKETHNALGSYTKALDKKLKSINLPSVSDDHLSARSDLIDRAIAMHFLREGQFEVASAFIDEAGHERRNADREEDVDMDARANIPEWTRDLVANDSPQVAGQTSSGGNMRSEFQTMYRILHAIQDEGELEPAISWAKANREALNRRGSDLEFELCQLRFVELFTGLHGANAKGIPVTANGVDAPQLMAALEYARKTFADMPTRYVRQTSILMTSLVFAPTLHTSPYRSYFYNADSWAHVTNSFVREFCGLLGLSELSPLYTAVTAGGIALPVLKKLEDHMGRIGGQWTSANELPTEIALPSTYQFHSIFVCPVSKEQGTDSNPPMMLPCCHVIAKESLDALSRGSKRFKCPYCPSESSPRDAKIVFL